MEQREFSELYDKFDDVYNRVTLGRRDMKAFHDFVNGLISSQERFAKDMDTACKKALVPTLDCTLSTAYVSFKDVTSYVSTQFHSSVSHLKEISSELDKAIKYLKVEKTKLHDNYQKIYKDMESKKATHAKAKVAYEESIKKAETAVMNQRGHVGNDKVARKLEDAANSAMKDADRAHSNYLKAVRDCQAAQIRFEQETADFLSTFESIERSRLEQYHQLFQRVHNNHIATQNVYAEQGANLQNSVSAINVEGDIHAFILNTYTGNPPEPHVSYEPRHTEIINHFGDQSAVSESQSHQTKVQAIHAHMMRNSNQLASLQRSQQLSSPSDHQQFGSSITPSHSMASQFHESHEALPVGGSGVLAQALYDFAGQEQGDLSFSAGDVISLINYDSEEEWWHGSLHGNVGTFPRDYVQRIDNSAPVAATGPPALPFDVVQQQQQPPMGGPPPVQVKHAKALFPFEGMSDDELTFQVGDILIVHGEIDGWYEGEDSTGKRGIFPANYVDIS